MTLSRHLVRKTSYNFLQRIVVVLLYYYCYDFTNTESRNVEIAFKDYSISKLSKECQSTG